MAVLRPGRCDYTIADLGPTKFTVNDEVYERKDLQIQSPRGYSLECSHFRPADAGDSARPCVIYLHGCSSSRLEALEMLPMLLPQDLDVFCLDFGGCGMSGGDYVSLGHYEDKDLGAVIRHLRKSGLASSIALWGRSMGAATAILRASKDRCLAACVLDSPFRDLRMVAGDLVRQAFPVPQFMIDVGVDVVRQEVFERAGFDPDAVLPIKSAPRARCPAMFAVAYDDCFVLPRHTEELHDAWGGERTLRTFRGGHNGERPEWFLEEAACFLKLQCNHQAECRRTIPLKQPPVPEVKKAYGASDDDIAPSRRRPQIMVAAAAAAVAASRAASRSREEREADGESAAMDAQEGEAEGESVAIDDPGEPKDHLLHTAPGGSVMHSGPAALVKKTLRRAMGARGRRPQRRTKSVDWRRHGFDGQNPASCRSCSL